MEQLESSFFLKPQFTTPLPPSIRPAMSSTKTPDAGVMTPKSRKSGGKSNNAAPAKSTPLSKSVNNVPATPATENAANRKRSKHRNRRQKRKHKEGTEVEAVDDVEEKAVAVAGKKKTKSERKLKESSKGAGETIEKESVVVPRSNWKLSPSLGGRFLQLDPVFTKNEKYGIYIFDSRSRGQSADLYSYLKIYPPCSLYVPQNLLHKNLTPCPYNLIAIDQAYRENNLIPH